MNEIVNKFSLPGDEIMPKMPLKELGCTYSAYLTYSAYSVLLYHLDKACLT